MGAAIAAGSQLEKGIWALFVIAARVVRGIRYLVSSFSQNLIMIQCPWDRVNAMLSRIRTSPMRFVRAVSIPAARDFGFW